MNISESSAQLRKRQILVVICLLVAGLAAVALVIAAQGLKLPHDLMSWIQIVQGLLTTLAIAIGGLWAFYIFVLGRSYMAHVQIHIMPKYVKDLAGDSGAVVSVKLKNTGRTRVRKEACKMSVMLLTEERLNSLKVRPTVVERHPAAALKLIDTSLNQKGIGFPTGEYAIFDGLIGLEPDEEAAEDNLFILGKTSTLKIDVEFTGIVFARPSLFFGDSRRSWGSHTILDTRATLGDPTSNSEKPIE